MGFKPLTFYYQTCFSDQILKFLPWPSCLFPQSSQMLHQLIQDVQRRRMTELIRFDHFNLNNVFVARGGDWKLRLAFPPTCELMRRLPIKPSSRCVGVAARLQCFTRFQETANLLLLWLGCLALHLWHVTLSQISQFKNLLCHLFSLDLHLYSSTNPSGVKSSALLFQFVDSRWYIVFIFAHLFSNFHPPASHSTEDGFHHCCFVGRWRRCKHAFDWLALDKGWCIIIIIIIIIEDRKKKYNVITIRYTLIAC